MQNNALMQIINAARGGQNPVTVINKMAGSDPRIAFTAQLMHGKNSAQLRGIAQNMAREKGVDINQLAASLGLTSK